MNLQDLAVAGDHNLALTWEALGGHGAFAVTTSDTVTFTSSGLPIPFFNGAFTAAQCRHPATVIADAMSFFGGRGVPYLLWVREGVDEPLLAAGRAAGLRDAGGPPGMVLPTIGDIPSPPPRLDVRIATSLAALDDHRAVVASGFGMPPEIATQILGTGLLGEPGIAIAVGYEDGVPVTTALVSCTRDTAGVYNVATVAGHRGKGYGAAATWAVIAEGALRGCTHSVLQSSADGYPVYRRMGFVDVGQYVQLEGPPA